MGMLAGHAQGPPCRPHTADLTAYHYLSPSICRVGSQSYPPGLPYSQAGVEHTLILGKGTSTTCNSPHPQVFLQAAALFAKRDHHSTCGQSQPGLVPGQPPHPTLPSYALTKAPHAERVHSHAPLLPPKSLHPIPHSQPLFLRSPAVTLSSRARAAQRKYGNSPAATRAPLLLCPIKTAPLPHHCSDQIPAFIKRADPTHPTPAHSLANCWGWRDPGEIW